MHFPPSASAFCAYGPSAYPTSPTPSATTAGLLVKASVVKWGHMDEIDLGRRHPPDRRAAFSIVQDMLALAAA